VINSQGIRDLLWDIDPKFVCLQCQQANEGLDAERQKTLDAPIHRDSSIDLDHTASRSLLVTLQVIGIQCRASHPTARSHHQWGGARMLPHPQGLE
jgi:hypothetical protein